MKKTSGVPSPFMMKGRPIVIMTRIAARRRNPRICRARMVRNAMAEIFFIAKFKLIADTKPYADFTDKKIRDISVIRGKFSFYFFRQEGATFRRRPRRLGGFGRRQRLLDVQ